MSSQFDHQVNHQGTELFFSRRALLLLLRSLTTATLVACTKRFSAESPHHQVERTLPTGALPAASTTMPRCIVTPAQTEGPYFVEAQLKRSDLRTDPSDGSRSVGLPLQLQISVFSVTGTDCQALSGAKVDIWHCDAQGLYSNVVDPNFNTLGKQFLRGYQITDSNGSVEFITIYPGWYSGRAVHLHFKLRMEVAGQNREFTSQLYFDDAITAQVQRQLPYPGEGWLRNAEDIIFQAGGEQLLLELSQDASGYVARFEIGLRLI